MQGPGRPIGTPLDVKREIGDALRGVMPRPLRLWSAATTDLPTAADFTGGLAWNTTSVRVTWSDGSAWVEAQPYDATLAALAAYNTNGIVCQTAADTFAGRTLQAPAAGFTITNPGGVAGNPTFALADDLSAVEGLSTTGLAARTASNTWATRTITGTANQITVTNGGGTGGDPTLSFPTSLVHTGRLALTNATASTSVATIEGVSGAGIIVDFDGGGNSFFDGTKQTFRTIAGSTIAVLTSVGLGVGGEATGFNLEIFGSGAANTAMRSSDTSRASFRGYINSTTEAGKIAFGGSDTQFEVAGNLEMTLSASGLNLASGNTLQVNGTQVVTSQQAAVADATGAGDVVAQLNALLARLRTHGLIAT